MRLPPSTRLDREPATRAARAWRWLARRPISHGRAPEFGQPTPMLVIYDELGDVPIDAFGEAPPAGDS